MSDSTETPSIIAILGIFTFFLVLCKSSKTRARPVEKFKLFQLPHVAFKRVLQRMSVDQRIAFSLCSTKMSRLTQELHLFKVTKLEFEYRNKKSISILALSGSFGMLRIFIVMDQKLQEDELRFIAPEEFFHYCPSLEISPEDSYLEARYATASFKNCFEWIHTIFEFHRKTEWDLYINANFTEDLVEFFDVLKCPRRPARLRLMGSDREKVEAFLKSRLDFSCQCCEPKHKPHITRYVNGVAEEDE